MRVMSMHKTNAATEAGALPTPELMAGMGPLMDDMAKAGILESGEGLRPSSTGIRLTFSGGQRTITNGPFKGDNEIIAGFCMVRTRSIEEAMQWATRFADLIGDTEIDIRPVCEMWDLGFGQKPADDPTTRFMLTHKIDEKRSDAPHTPEMQVGMQALVADMTAAGVFLQSGGLEPSTKATRLQYAGNRRTITDGPFAESKELIAGYTILDVKSVDEAIHWADRFAKLHGDVEIDIRRLW
jgi:hypothetical protein